MRKKIKIMAIDPITAGIAAVGALSSIGGGIFGSRKARKAAKRERELLRQKEAANEAWYARNYHEDYLNSVEAQNALRRTREAWNDRLNRERGRQAVTGGTPEQMARVHEAGGEAYGETVAALAAQGSANKRAVDAKKAEMDNDVLTARSAIANAEQQAGQNMLSNSINAGVAALQAGASAMGGKGAATAAGNGEATVKAAEESLKPSNSISSMDVSLKASDFTNKIDEPFNPAGKAWWEVAEKYKKNVTY